MTEYGSTSTQRNSENSGNPASKLLVRLKSEVSHPVHLKAWEFPGWGVHHSLKTNLTHRPHTSTTPQHAKLSEWRATAICGNDILSSCLYVSGLVASKSGVLSPIVLLLVACLLYLYRFIYGEVLAAIPLNGGSYNVLLNTTSKRLASFAASLAVLSYLATGVVSGTSACTYLTTLVSIDLIQATIGLLLFFAVLSFIGISESASLALGIFVAHVVTLTALAVTGLIYIIKDEAQTLKYNFITHLVWPDIDMAGTIVRGDVGTALFYGVATAMLGISGFESSSQFVEEQQPGVFPKTLRNMWWGVAIFNPLLSFLSMGVMPLEQIISKKNTVLAEMAFMIGGKPMQLWVCIDAFIVLSGAVLTAYVGIIGLSRRLASDRVLPSFLLKTNSWRKTNHFIIFGYFVLASSLVLCLQGNVETLSGVYTYAFLGLMMLFGCGCMLLKFKRPLLPREVVAPWWSCILGVIMVFVGFLGNLLGDPQVLTYFALYFLSVLVLVMVMFERIFLLRIFLYVLQRICPSRATSRTTNETTGAKGGRTIARTIQEINESPILFFCKKPELSTINKAILYVRTNEQTSNLQIVHVHHENSPEIQEFADIVSMFDRIYPKLKIDFLAVELPNVSTSIKLQEGDDDQEVTSLVMNNETGFGPDVIDWLSTELNVPKNMMFIKSPDHLFQHKIETLGGVRVITG